MKHGCWLQRITLILFYLSTSVVIAQTSQSTDSLTTYLRTHSPTDTAYIRVMDKVIYSRIYQKAEYATADSMSRQMADIAGRLNDGLGLVKAYRNRGMISYLTTNYEQALTYFKKTLEIAEQRHLPPVVIYSALSNVVVGYEKVGNDPMVLQTALKAIRLQEQFNLRPRAPVPHRLVGGTLVKMGKVKQAMPYYREAAIIFRENGDQRGIAIFENQLGDLYNDIKEPKQALPHLYESLKLAEQIKFELLQFDVLDGLATSMRLLTKPTEGLVYAQRALTIAQKQQNKLATCTVYGTIASLYQTSKEYTNAEGYLKKALVLAEENDYKDERKKLVQQLADLYGEQKKYQLAYAFQLEKNKQTDSATTVRTNAEVQRLVAKYETGKKEAQIKLLQQQAKLNQQEAERTRFRTNTILIMSLLVLLLGASVSAWLLNRARVRRLEEAQKLRKQIAHDLHDEVGSTLSSISLLSSHTDTLLTQNRAETAQKMVQKIYADARQILESMDEIIWTINPGNDSLQRIALRLQEYAQPLMESKGIHFAVQLDTVLEETPISMEVRRGLYLIGKEAINNLVKYSQATQATLRFDRQHNQLRVVIEDNGRGFTPGQSGERTGQTSMKQRAEAMGGTLAVETAPGQGTRLQLLVNQ